MKLTLTAIILLLAVFLIPSASFATLAGVPGLSPALLTASGTPAQPSGAAQATPYSADKQGHAFMDWLKKQHPQNKSPFSCDICYKNGLTCCIDPLSGLVGCADPEIGCGE
ncbi:MAG TPA: hypothetical protein VGP73_18565 [Thermoanaerobaculia bacterium]